MIFRALGNAFKAAGTALAAFFADWFDPPFQTQVVQELPQSLEPRVLYIVDEDGYQEQAAMRCPCGCKQTLHMNLLPDERPCWRVSMTPLATLHPSVWRKVGCKSHFWLRNGRIYFV